MATRRGITCFECPHLRGNLLQWRCGLTGAELEEEDLNGVDEGGDTIWCPMNMPPGWEEHQRRADGVPRRTSHQWTEQEIQLLATHWMKWTNEQLAAQLGVSERQVRHMAQKIGMARKSDVRQAQAKGGITVKIKFGSWSIALKAMRFLKSALVDGKAWFQFAYQKVAVKVTFIRRGRLKPQLVGKPFESFRLIAQVMEWVEAVVLGGLAKKVGSVTYAGVTFDVVVERV